ncbi:nuclease-related domain-containing protein [Lentibacillus cibarius]|uniref:nuclease-related domain-containing protein n=1 Tax=Lentibacillus cibarius TaxID=2583219 RepID=UPI001F36770F|nr:nuclease-related domain-containing protein [Lentibacillus cibarius]
MSLLSPTVLKPRCKSHALLAYEALFRQVLPQYRKHESIISEYRKEKAGYDGERNVDYKLSTYPRKDFLVVQGIRLKNPPFYFQIDTLILTRRFICILEIKNQKGTLKYDANLKQMVQEIDGKVISYKDPILQAEAQKTHLREWLAMHGIFNVPIEALVVIAYPSTIIENVQGDPGVYNQIIHREGLHQHLERVGRNHPNHLLTNAQLKKLCRVLADEDTPLQTDILEKHGVSGRHLIRGIPCSKCHTYPMKRLYKNWQCQKCLATKPKAHERVILDHFLLHQPTVTNQECRNLLQIDSPRTAYNIMNTMGLHKSGKNSARVYHAPPLSEFPQDSSFPFNLQNHIAKQSLD